MTSQQQAARYYNGLNYLIQEKIGLQTFFSVEEVENLALKAERLSSHKHVKRPATEASTSVLQPDKVVEDKRNATFGDRNAEKGKYNNALRSQGRLGHKGTGKNPYSRPTIDKCYHCNQTDHKSNVCPQRRQVGLTSHEDGNGNEHSTQDDLEGTKFAEEEGDQVSCVVQKLLFSPKLDSSQRNRIFHSKCSLNQKVCNLIIDNRSCENIVLRALVDHLKLPIEPHSSPYQIGWIKMGRCLR